MAAVFFWLGVAGLFFDWRYIRKGGPPPTSIEKRYLLYAIALSAASLCVLFILGGSAAGVGNAAGLIAAIILLLWSGRRYAIRRHTR